MSGTARERRPETVQFQDSEAGLDQPLDLSFPFVDSNSSREAEATRVRGDREQALMLPELAPPMKTFWQATISDAFTAALQDLVSSARKGGAGFDEVGDAAETFASEVAESLVERGLDNIGGTDGLWDLAQEYPVPAALLGGVVGYGASEWLDTDPTLSLNVKLSPISDNLTGGISHDLGTGDTSYMLRFKYEW